MSVYNHGKSLVWMFVGIKTVRISRSFWNKHLSIKYSNSNKMVNIKIFCYPKLGHVPIVVLSLKSSQAVNIWNVTQKEEDVENIFVGFVWK